jgi:hypothetical protein
VNLTTVLLCKKHWFIIITVILRTRNFCHTTIVKVQTLCEQPCKNRRLADVGCPAKFAIAHAAGVRRAVITSSHARHLSKTWIWVGGRNDKTAEIFLIGLWSCIVISLCEDFVRRTDFQLTVVWLFIENAAAMLNPCSWYPRLSTEYN